MSGFKLSQRSFDKLIGVHPVLVEVVERAIEITEVDFAVIEGTRSFARQKKLVAEGKSKTLNSKHLSGRAVDVMAVGDLDLDGDVDHQDKSIAWNKEHYNKIASAMGQAADELGTQIRWGGTFKNFYDGPHFELVDRQILDT